MPKKLCIAPVPRDLVDARGELSPESSCWDSEFRAVITFHMPSDTIRGASRKKNPSVRCRTVLVGQGTLNGESSVSAIVPELLHVEHGV